MFKIIYTPSGTITSEHSTREAAENALEMVETIPSSHEIIEVADYEDDNETYDSGSSQDI
jgi:hypothetical protein